jgi:tripartite-type tricarboxylate transporter receptor subunit TctC
MASIRLAACLALIAAVVSSVDAPAQTATSAWPQRAVRIIVGFQPGSATDITARLFGERLSARWGKPVVIDNRPGPDGLVAVGGFAGARDDHTLLFSIGGPLTINPLIHQKLPYDPERDLVPIVSASDSFLAVAANASLGIDSIDALVKRTQAEPGKLNWAATPGLPQFAFAGFIAGGKLDMVQVSYRDFTPALSDLGEGRISVAVTSVVALLPLVRASKVKLLTLTNRMRSPAVPEVPTAAEAGYPALAVDGFQGFFGWRGMPADLRDRIAEDVRAVAADPAVAERLAGIGQALRVGTTAEFVAMIEEQRAKIAGIARDIGLKPQP